MNAGMTLITSAIDHASSSVSRSDTRPPRGGWWARFCQGRSQAPITRSGAITDGNGVVAIGPFGPCPRLMLAEAALHTERRRRARELPILRTAWLLRRRRRLCGDQGMHICRQFDPLVRRDALV